MVKKEDDSACFMFNWMSFSVTTIKKLIEKNFFYIHSLLFILPLYFVNHTLEKYGLDYFPALGIITYFIYFRKCMDIIVLQHY